MTAGAQTQAPNTIATYAGGGTNTGAASNAYLPRPILAIRDTAGNTYISVPALGIIYKVATGSGTISIFAGSGILGFSGDGGLATSAQLDYPEGMAFDSAGNFYIADTDNNRIRMVTPGGTISTVAGTGAEYNGAGFYGGYSGDGGQATEAFLNQPSDVAFDSTGNMYIADSSNNVVRIVNMGTRVISTFAGTFNNGQGGYGGDGGAATSALLNDPVSVTTDTSGNLYISDENNCIVRKVDTSTSHIITTYAGTPQTCGYSGDGGAATSAALSKLSAVRMDGTNNLYVADTFTNRIRKVDNTTSHDISTIAGNGTACTTPTGCGDGGSATAAMLNHPIGVAIDSSGNILVTDSGDARIRVVSSGSISAFAGGGTGGDGGAATSAVLGLPYITALDSSGNLYITDTFGVRIREVNAKTHAISTFAGNGVRGTPGQSNGDGGPATSAQLIHPIGLAFDSQGNLYVVDSEAYVVRKISTTGTISTVIGNGQQCNAAGNPNTFPACGDGGSPTSASLFIPEGIAIDTSGNLYVSDAGLNRIRIVTNGVISNYAGNADNNTCSPSTAACGDGGPATSALLNSPFGIAFDAQGNLDIVDTGDNRIRQVTQGGTSISTIAFTGEPTFGGDGGDPTSASMYQPTAIAIDPNFNIFLSGGFDNIVRRIDALNFDGFIEYDSTATVAGDVDNLDGGYSGDGGPATKALLSNFGLSVDSNQNLYVADAGNGRIRIVPMAPVGSWEPTSLTNFGSLLVGQVSDAQDIIFSNSGLASLNVTLQSPVTDFSISDCSSDPAPPEGSCIVTVQFTPAAGGPTGVVNGNVVLATNDPNHPSITFPVSGTVATTGFALTVNVAGSGFVTSDPSGIICPTEGCTATYASGSTVTLSAFGSAGYGFTGFSTNCTPVQNVPYECTIVMSQAATVTATFGAPQVTVTGSGNGSGTITSSPAGINCTVTNQTTSGTCTATYPVGTATVTLSATANSGSTFVGWAASFCSTESPTNTCQVSPSSIITETVTGVFSVPRKAFTKGDVFVGTESNMIWEYSSAGTLVQVLPSLSGNEFAGFVYGMTFDNNGTLYAASPNATGAAGIATFSSNGTGPTAFGGTSTTTAGSVRVDAGGDVFVGLEANSETGNLLEFAPGNTTAPTANFYPAYYGEDGIFAFELAQDDVTIYYTLGGPSIYSYNTQLGLQNPDVTDTLPGIYAGDLRQLPDTSLLVADGDRIVRVNSTTGAVTQTYQPSGVELLLGLTLDPDGTDFWTDDSITGIVYKINIASGTVESQFNTNLGLNANFGLIGVGGVAVFGSQPSGGDDLTVDITGLGSGSVTSSPAGISCPPTCTANFVPSTQVTLTQTPGTGSTFGGWSGACSGSGSCVVTMSAAEAVTATFNASTFALTVTEAGTGSGSVTSSPVGITCPSACTANYGSGTVVTLTATPGSGSTFAGWSGAGCSGTGTCTVTMSAAESVTATFNTTTTFALTVTDAGTGTGTVTSSPAGITCPSTCSANFASATVVTLTATPNSGSTFTGWSGNAACSGTGTCAITMSAAQSVTATFNTSQFALTVTKAGTGTGTVTSSPAGINCGTTCTANFNSNASVVLTAAAGVGSTFTGWSGNAACSGTGTCTITMSAAESVTATFNTGSPVTISVDILNNGTSGVGTVTDSTGVINCTTITGQGQTGTCSTTYPVNSTVTFTETPGAGSVFTGWTSQNNPCQTGTAANVCTITVVNAGSIFANVANGTGTFTLTVALPSNLSNSTGGGSVGSGVTGGGIANCTFNGTNPLTGTCSNNAEKSGAVLELIPVPTDNSTFGGYAGTCPSQVGNNCYVTMSQNQTVTPVFTAVVLTLSVSITGNGSLVDTANTGKINCTGANGITTGTCTATYTAGTSATLTETPGTGYTFSAFGGSFCTSSTSTTCTITFNAGNTYSESATFTINTYLLNMSTEGGSGTGTVTSNANNLGGTINCGPNNQPPSGCGLEEQYNWPITLTATPTSGSTFAGWAASGASGFILPCTTSPTCTFNMPVSQISGLSVTATFTKTATFALTVTDAGTGSGTVTSSPIGINCTTGGGTGCSANFNSGQQVTLTASAGTGSSFSGWTGACTGTGSCVVTMNAAEAVTATFNTATTFALTVTDAGTGSGSVASVPSGINCPSTCSANYASGTQVTLTATPASGSTFAGWSGACTGSGSCPVTMSAAESVTATFTATQFALTVTKAGSGTGTVTSAPAGISCGATCNANFNSGSTVTLTAAAGSGSTFAGWSGAGCTGTGTCVVTMSAAESVTATFNSSQFALTVTLSGNGSGSVMSNPAGITCPSTCSANYASGTTVTLTASAGSGSTFAGWTGADCGGNTCTVTMNSAQSVTATFNTTANPTLTVVLAGTGTGSVSFTSSSTYTCSDTTGVVTGTCSASFPSGTVVNVSEIPGTGSVFAGWSGGGCSGTGSTCNVTLTASMTVTATFNKPTYALTVTEAGSGTGTVASSPAGISCPATCSANYATGTTVTLTATAGSGSTFAGWSGQSGCGGTGTCTINMSSAQSVTATFNKVQYALTVTLAGTGSGTVVSTPQGINCGSGCTADFDSGSQVTLTATAGSGSAFGSWSANCAPAQSNPLQCTITMSAAESVTATFNTGANFTFAPTAGTTTTVTTSPGGNIVVGLTVSGPVKETINLGCTSNAPQFLTCVITPTAVNLTGNGTTQVAIVLKSYCQGAAPGLPGDSPTRPLPPAGILGLLGLATLLIGGMWSRGDRRRLALTMAAMLVMAVTGAACGNLPQGPNGATPAGNYVLTVTASAAGQPTQSVQINVQVN
jgi:hypothetical protein